MKWLIIALMLLWPHPMAADALSARWQADTLIVDVGAPGCLYLQQGSLETWIGCDEPRYTLPATGVDSHRSPVGGTLILRNSRAQIETARLLVPNRLYVVILPVVVRG